MSKHFGTCDHEQVAEQSWQTECGELYILIRGTLKESRREFCHGCGLKIREDLND